MDEFVGLDPVLCRLEAIRFDEVAEDYEWAAKEYREIDRIGEMDGIFIVPAKHAEEVAQECRKISQILREKSDAVEAIMAGTPNTREGRTSSTGVSSFTSGRYTPPTTRPVTLRLQGDGSNSEGLPENRSFDVDSDEISASFWADLSDVDIQKGKSVADRIMTGWLGPDGLSDRDRDALACWWFAKQHDDKIIGPSIAAVQARMQGRDVSLITQRVTLFDTAAYSSVLDIVDEKRIDEMFRYLQSKEAKKLSTDDLALEVKRRFGDDDPLVQSATQIYIRYQLQAAAWDYNERTANPDWYGRYGSILPGIEMRSWAIGAVYGNRDRSTLVTCSPATANLVADAITGLYRGDVVDDYARNRVFSIVHSDQTKFSNWLNELSDAATLMLVSGGLGNALTSSARGAALLGRLGIRLEGLVGKRLSTAVLGVLGDFPADMIYVGLNELTTALEEGRPLENPFHPDMIGRDAAFNGLIGFLGLGLARSIRKNTDRLRTVKSKIDRGRKTGQKVGELVKEETALIRANVDAEKTRRQIREARARLDSKRKLDQKLAVKTRAEAKKKSDAAKRKAKKRKPSETRKPAKQKRPTRSPEPTSFKSPLTTSRRKALDKQIALEIPDWKAVIKSRSAEIADQARIQVSKALSLKNPDGSNVIDVKSLRVTVKTAQGHADADQFLAEVAVVSAATRLALNPNRMPNSTILLSVQDPKNPINQAVIHVNGKPVSITAMPGREVDIVMLLDDGTAQITEVKKSASTFVRDLPEFRESLSEMARHPPGSKLHVQAEAERDATQVGAGIAWRDDPVATQNRSYVIHIESDRDWRELFVPVDKKSGPMETPIRLLLQSGIPIQIGPRKLSLVEMKKAADWFDSTRLTTNLKKVSFEDFFNDIGVYG